MTNKTVGNKFSQALPARSLSMMSTGEKLYSYATVIAQHVNGEMVINETKYSTTTSRQLNQIRGDLISAGKTVKVVNNVPRNAGDLRPFIL